MTDPKIVEIVARAICASQDLNPDGTWFLDGSPAWTNYEEEATAAIEAHVAALREAGFVIVPREPTGAMLDKISSDDAALTG